MLRPIASLQLQADIKECTWKVDDDTTHAASGRGTGQWGACCTITHTHPASCAGRIKRLIPCSCMVFVMVPVFVVARAQQ